MSSIRKHRKKYTFALIAKRKEMARRRARVQAGSAVRQLEQQSDTASTRSVAIVVGPKEFAYQIGDR